MLLIKKHSAMFILALTTLLIVSCSGSSKKVTVVSEGVYSFSGNTITQLLANTYNNGDGLVRLEPPKDIADRERFKIVDGKLAHYNLSGRNDYTLERKTDTNSENPFLGVWSLNKNEVDYNGFDNVVEFSETGYVLKFVNYQE